MRAALSAIFGARGQVVVGCVLVAATVFQAVWWGVLFGPPDAEAIFWLSVEALLFAAYGVIATGLGFRATERVEAHVQASLDIGNEGRVSP